MSGRQLARRAWWWIVDYGQDPVAVGMVLAAILSLALVGVGVLVADDPGAALLTGLGALVAVAVALWTISRHLTEAAERRREARVAQLRDQEKQREEAGGWSGPPRTERQALVQIASELHQLRGHLERSLPIWGGSAHHPKPPDLHRSLHSIAQELEALRGLAERQVNGAQQQP